MADVKDIDWTAFIGQFAFLCEPIDVFVCAFSGFFLNTGKENVGDRFF